MGLLQVWCLGRHLVSVLLVVSVGIMNNQSVNARQGYNVETYVCSDSGARSCGTFVLYRAQEGYSDVSAIATLFNTNATQLRTVNKLPADMSQLTTGQALFVPLTCICFNRTSYANLTHIIAAGDTFYVLNRNDFGYLSTTLAIINANPTLDYTQLMSGMPMIWPVRCACPSRAQNATGVRSLVTYPIANGDTLRDIASSFGVPLQSTVDANSLQYNSQIIANTTLLIPINSTTPQYTPVSSPSSTAPVPAGVHRNGPETGVCVAIIASLAVWPLLALSF